MRSDRRDLLVRILGLLLVIASTAAIVQSWALAARQRSYVECQAAWSQAYAQAAVFRGTAADQDRVALDVMVGGILQSKSREDTRLVLETYVTTRVEADRIRAANPLPPLPNDVCK